MEPVVVVLPAIALSKIVGLLVTPPRPSSLINRWSAARDQAAADMVQPHELVTLVQCEWIHEGSLFGAPCTRTSWSPFWRVD